MLGWIHEGTVRHRRYGVKPHDFRMSIRMPCVNVDRIQEVCRLSRFWSSNQENLASWQQRDFGFDEHRSIGDEIRDRIHRTLGFSDISNVYLLAHPRYFGHQFNPVSFYFAHNAEGVLQAIVTEITNIPWGERHAYVHDCSNGQRSFDFAKQFHISPFLEMDHRHQWRFHWTDRHFAVHMENHAHGERKFDATFATSKVPLTAEGLRRCLWGTPLATVRVVAGIYWHAMQVWRKGNPYIKHPGTHQLQESVA